MELLAQCTANVRGHEDQPHVPMCILQLLQRFATLFPTTRHLQVTISSGVRNLAEWINCQLFSASNPCFAAHCLKAANLFRGAYGGLYEFHASSKHHTLHTLHSAYIKSTLSSRTTHELKGGGKHNLNGCWAITSQGTLQPRMFKENPLDENTRHPPHRNKRKPRRWPNFLATSMVLEAKHGWWKHTDVTQGK